MIWIPWAKVVWQLRPAFNREKTFFWFVICLIGISTRVDQLGVSSILRALGLESRHYHSLLNFFHSNAINLQLLSRVWAQVAFKVFYPFLETHKQRVILLLDGLKVPKEGLRMPGVKKIFQGSQNNSKPTYIFGHSCQGIGFLVKAGISFLCIPLVHRIQKGLGHRRGSIVMRALDLINCCGLKGAYLIGDAYYYSGPFMKELLKKSIFLVTRVRSNAVAFKRPIKRRKGRGRPKKYGEKVKLKNLFRGPGWKSCSVDLYGYEVEAFVKEVVLISKNFENEVKYVLVKMGSSRVILASNDLELSGEEIIELYGKRFKIEVSFKAMIHQMGGYTYRFWSKNVEKTRKSGVEKRDSRKEHAYHLHIQLSIIAHGLVNYLAVAHESLVWSNVKVFIRTLRPGVVPSEWIVQMAMREGLKKFGWVKRVNKNFAKFLNEKQGLCPPVVLRESA